MHCPSEAIQTWQRGRQPRPGQSTPQHDYLAGIMLRCETLLPPVYGGPV